MNLITGVVDGNDNNRLIGFGVSFPSMTEALQKNRNGKLFPWGWLRLLRVMKCHATDTVDLVLIGVLPEYRSKGANALIFADLIEQYHRYGFKWAEAMPQMESTRVCRASGSIWKACSTVAAAATEESYRNLKKNKNN